MKEAGTGAPGSADAPLSAADAAELADMGPGARIDRALRLAAPGVLLLRGAESLANDPITRRLVRDLAFGCRLCLLSIAFRL